MIWLARIPCRYCQLRGYDDAAHQVTHDGPTAPTCDRQWGMRCPCTSRLQLIDPALHEWSSVATVIGPHVHLHSALILLEW